MTLWRKLSGSGCTASAKSKDEKEDVRDIKIVAPDIILKQGNDQICCFMYRNGFHVHIFLCKNCYFVIYDEKVNLIRLLSEYYSVVCLNQKSKIKKSK